jgi:hypothetical protein
MSAYFAVSFVLCRRLDNCYDIFYKDRAAISKFRSQVHPRLQRAYWSTPKPRTGFDKVSLNVVIHARRGDSTVRTMGKDFINNAMHALRRAYPAALFWIHTDGNPGDLYFELVDVTNVRVFGKNESDLLCTVHQMINADVLIVSESGLSRTAALIGHSGSTPVSMVMGCQENSIKPRFNTELLGWQCSTPCDAAVVKLEINRLLKPRHRDLIPLSWKWNGLTCGRTPFVASNSSSTISSLVYGKILINRPPRNLNISARPLSKVTAASVEFATPNDDKHPLKSVVFSGSPSMLRGPSPISNSAASPKAGPTSRSSSKKQKKMKNGRTPEGMRDG